MGFVSVDDMVNKTSVLGQVARVEWQKQTAAVGVAGRWYGMFGWSGSPVAGTYPGVALSAAVLNESSQGAMWHGGGVLPATKHVLNASALSTSSTGVPGVLLLVDMLMYYPSINMAVSTEQVLDNTVTLPRYPTGEGVQAYLEATAATGATASNTTITYTNSDGVGGRTLGAPTANLVSASVTSIVHSGTAANSRGPFLPLAAGDRGVRSVESVRLSASTGGGGAALVLCKPLLRLPITTFGVPTLINTMFDVPPLPHVVDGACLSWLYLAGAATAAASAFNGNIDVGWG